jgi:hypothetical protein
MTGELDDLRLSFSRLQRGALLVAALAGAACVLGFVLDRRSFFEGWLLGLLYWIAVPLGSLALVMLHNLTGGSWGFAVRRLFEAALRTLPLFALLFVPLALGLGHLYPWSHEDLVARDPLLQHKSSYLNSTGFLARAALYFAVWLALSVSLDRLTLRRDRSPDPDLARRMRRISGPGIPLYGIAMTFAAVDWAMSLEPHWFSTIYGAIFVVGQVLTTLAFGIAVSAWLSQREPFSRWLQPGHYHDLGKLLFAFVLLWAYVNFSQFLIVWSGNLAEETPWYLRRAYGVWQPLALALILFHFALPFLVLLSRRTKRNPRALGAIAMLLLALRFLDLYWLIVPAFGGQHGGADVGAHGGELAFHWMYLAAPVAIGALFLAFFAQQLKGRPLLALEDAHLENALEPAPLLPHS